jgi:hypothetical protein
MVRSDAAVVAIPIREGFSDEVANAKERRRKIPVLADDQTSAPCFFLFRRCFFLIIKKFGAPGSEE